MADPVSMGIVLGIEIVKLINQERAIKALAAQAGLSPEALDAALVKARAEYQPLDPTKLPEVA